MVLLAMILGVLGGICGILGILSAVEVLPGFISGTEVLGSMVTTTGFWWGLAGLLILASIATSVGRERYE
jgi:hypothetical protein